MTISSENAETLALNALGKGLTIIASAILLCRMFGFLMYVLWGRTSIVGYLIGRIFLVVFLFVTALNIPMINPIRLLYDLNKDVPMMAIFSAMNTSFVSYVGVVLIVIVVLTGVNSLLVKYHIASEVKE